MKALLRLDECLESYRGALRIEPANATVRWNIALLKLQLGDLLAGWTDFEARWEVDGFPSERRAFTQPLWLGQMPLQGKTILLYGEQGYGDTIQFCRFVPMVAALGARVVLEVQKPLVGLLTNLPGVSHLLARTDSLPPFDYQTPLMSLALAFQTTLQTIPSPTAYLDAQPEKIARWKQVLGDRQSLRVGLVWSGSTTHGNDHNRSITLAEVLDGLPLGIEYISLQKEIREIDRTVLTTSSRIRHFGDALTDFSETAGLAACVDLIISVDTSVAHLGGAIGKPVWLMLPHAPDWRWLLDRKDSPWYAAMTLFRQPAAGDWNGVFKEMADELNKLAPDTCVPTPEWLQL